MTGVQTCALPIFFEFPIYQGKTREAAEVSAWEQFMILIMLQREWSDNSVSCSIYFDREREGNQIERMLLLSIPVIKSVSMLPHSTVGICAQMPYEGITFKEYKRRKSEIIDIDWTQLKGSDGIDSRFCTNDNCDFVPA